MTIEKDSIIFSGILGILLVLVFFILLPFNKAYEGLDTLSVIQILLAIFLAFMLYAFDYFSKKRSQRIKDNRTKKSHKMLKRLLNIQRDLLVMIQREPTRRGRIVFSEEEIDWYGYVKLSFPINNNEILRIQGTFSDVIDENLIEQILEFTTHTTFLFSLEKKVTRIGIGKMIKAIDSLIDDIDKILKILIITNLR